MGSWKKKYCKTIPKRKGEVAEMSTEVKRKWKVMPLRAKLRSAKGEE